MHRDLKPENILLAPGPDQCSFGMPKIVDFGIATVSGELLDPRETDQDQVVGTPLYMSPEQAGGERNLSPRTDLYSVALILYEIIAGAASLSVLWRGLRRCADTCGSRSRRCIPALGSQMPSGAWRSS